MAARFETLAPRLGDGVGDVGQGWRHDWGMVAPDLGDGGDAIEEWHRRGRGPVAARSEEVLGYLDHSWTIQYTRGESLPRRYVEPPDPPPVDTFDDAAMRAAATLRLSARNSARGFNS